MLDGEVPWLHIVLTAQVVTMPPKRGLPNSKSGWVPPPVAIPDNNLIGFGCDPLTRWKQALVLGQRTLRWHLSMRLRSPA